MELTYNDQLVVRSIYYAILEELVTHGYNVDDRLYTDAPAYNAAVKALRDAGHFIELHSESSRKSKGVKLSPSITISLENAIPGDIGAPPSQLIQTAERAWINGSLPGTASTLVVEIYLTSAKSKDTYLLNNILYNAMGKRKMIKVYNAPTEHFFTEQIVQEKLTSEDDNLTDTRLVYNVPDVFLGATEVHREGIVPINQINVDIEDDFEDQLQVP